MSNRRRRPSIPMEGGEYYYDDSDDEKDHRTASDKMYGNACSFGQFMLNPCLCLFMTLRMSCQRQYIHKIRSRLKVVHFVTLLPLLLLLRHYSMSTQQQQQSGLLHPLRLRSNEQLLEVQILIQSLDTYRFRDLGGWQSPELFRKPKPAKQISNETDFGDLVFAQLTAQRFQREIHPQDYEIYNTERDKEYNRMEMEESYPDKYEHDSDLDYKECRRPNWKTRYLPHCNKFHEMDMVLKYDANVMFPVDNSDIDLYIFSHGYYRDAWLVEQMERHEAIVLKTLRSKHNFTARIFGNVQRDAIVMERLTSSPHIINMYGHCGTSVMVEPIAYEIEEYVVPDGYMKRSELHDEVDVDPQNNYSVLEKLELALAMAESLAVLHGFEGGMIVHDDVQLCQWLRNRRGQTILGDFNRAEIREWNDEKGDYCKHNNGFAYGNYRSPEEFDGKDLDEKIDIFSFGNNVYALLTGLWPFYENEDDAYVQKEVIDGSTAFIDERYVSRSYGEKMMVELILKCWQYKSEDRPDIFEIVKYLRHVFDEAKFRQTLALEKQKASNY